ncbi:MATE family efflux transporter [Geosporobacter ferrireducens]|nr:MATE family efflux transporter [Geosporobacter ferrireducens]
MRKGNLLGKSMETVEVRKDIIKIAWPAILEMTLHTLVWTVDTAMVGRLNPASISAVSLGAQIMFITMMILGAVGVGATALVARNIGAGDCRRAGKIGAQALSIGIFISVGVTIVGMIFAEDIFRLAVKDVAVVELGETYLRHVLIGGFFLIPFGVSNSILRGAGKTNYTLRAVLLANSFNIIGDYVLIFGKWSFPALGVKGAALATGIAQILGALTSLYYLFSGKSGIEIYFKDLFTIDKDILKKLVNLSIPAAFELTMNDGSRLLTAIWIAQLGTVQFAANSVAVAAESLSFMPGYGFAIAATTLMGQNLGAKNIDRAKESVAQAAKYAVVLMASVAFIFLTVPYFIMSFFTTDADTVALAAKCIRVGALEQVPIAIAMVISGALKGAGDTQGPFKISLATNLGVRLPLIFLIVFVFRLNIVFVWLATALQFMLEAVLMVIRYRREGWRLLELK